MTMVDAMSRISQIQATLTQLSTGLAPAAGGLAPATGAGSAQPVSTADAFASALAATGAAPAAAAAAGATPGPGGSISGNAIVADASKYLGVPYVFGGEDSSGMDCSGLVQRVFKDLGMDVPRLVSGQATLGTEVGSLAQAQPGDLIVLKGDTHIAIYAGDHKIIHAPTEGKKVSLVDAYMTDDQIKTIRRVVPTTLPAAASTAAGTDVVAAAQLAALTGGSL